MKRFSAALLVCLLLAPTFAADDLAEPDRKLLEDSKVGSDVAALRQFFRKRTPTANDQRQIDALILQLSDRSFQRRKKATEALADWGPTALEALRRAVKAEDIEAVRRAERCIEEIERPGNSLSLAAVRQLARLKSADALAVLLAYLPFADDERVVETVRDALLNLADPKTPDTALLQALADRAPQRRAAAASVLGKHSDRAARAATSKLLSDDDVSVRFHAAQALLLGREKQAVVALIDLLSTAPAELRWQAEEVLARLPSCLKGEPDIPAGPVNESPEVLRQWRASWLAWWSKHEAAIDLTKYGDRLAYQNITLVPEMHARKVWEYGPDGKVRWELSDDLRLPIDAQPLSGGRVLVAELDGHRVTERDRAGKILWKHEVQTPIYCRRMPNGNTFISTNHACFIVTSAGKEVFRYTPENDFFIHSIQQMPTGNIVCISMQGDVREIAATGKVVRTIALAERGGWSGVEGLPGNRYLCVGGGKVREIDAAGKVLWKLDRGGACFATRLPSGNTLVVDNSFGLVEVTSEGKVVAERRMNSALWRVRRR